MATFRRKTTREQIGDYRKEEEEEEEEITGRKSAKKREKRKFPIED